MTGPLAIVCGSGRFPPAVAQAVRAQGREVFLIGLRGMADEAIARYPHAWIRMGQVGLMLQLARKAGASDILFVGAVNRPSGLRDLVPDWRLVTLLPKLLRGGDDSLLRRFGNVVADAGFTIRGVHEVAPELMLPQGPLGRATPGKAAIADGEFGLAVLDAISPFDIGQGAVIASRRVLALEAAEGTDLMLERVAALRASGRLSLKEGGGVFVKAAKSGQDIRLDTPALGPDTVANVRAAGLAGVFYAAGTVMAVDAQQMIEEADKAGIFLFGLARGGV